MTDLDAIRARDAAANDCDECQMSVDMPHHGPVEEGCPAPQDHHEYVRGTPRDDDARDRRALLAEVDRLTVLLGAAACAPCEGDAERARALPVIEAARALLAEHTETVSQGYHSWDDPVCRDSESERRPGHHYGWMSACSSCGTPDEYAEPWPCTAHPALRAALAEYDR